MRLVATAEGRIGGEKRGYFYDAAWNLNRRTNNATTYTFPVNSLNQLTTDPANGGSISYDSNGNRASPAA